LYCSKTHERDGMLCLLLLILRQFIPVSYGGIDFSPIIVILIIIFLQQFLVGSLLMASQKMFM